MVDLKLFSVFLVVLFTTSSFAYAGTSRFSSPNVEVLKHLKRLNKPPVKTIKSPDGDIVDCVLITNQPSFDHPLLKNHTIQTMPTYHPNWSDVSTSKEEGISQLWHLNEKCPEGTIPIKRTNEEDLLRASSLERYGKKSYSVAQRMGSTNHIHSTAEADGEFYGTKAIFNIWNPRIEQYNEFSLGQLWLVAGSFASGDLNTIEVGWHVFPSFNRNYNTRLFIYWTRDGYQSTGCYNLLCYGFIQTSSVTMVGGSLFPVSQLRGNQAEMSIYVWKDPKEGNWWLQVGGNILGYWPSAVFSSLSTSASAVQWGGEVMTYSTDGYTATQMGSGQFAEQGYGASSYIRNIQVVDRSNKLNDVGYIRPFNEEVTCYDAITGNNGVWGNYMYYGGPGRNPNCQ